MDVDRLRFKCGRVFSLHAALTKKRKISDSRALVWCADRSYTPYTFGVMLDGKEERKKEEQNQNFQVQFSVM